MGFARLLAGLILGALVAAACGGESADDATPTTTQAPAATALPADELVGQPAGRSVAEVLYQLVVVEGGCGDRELTPPETEGELAPQLDAVFEALSELAARCDDPAEWTTAMMPVIQRLDDLDGAMRVAEGLSARAREELPVTDRQVDLGPFAVRAVERLHQTLRQSNQVDASNLWFSSQHLGLTSDIREAVATDAVPDAVIVGSSIAYRGIDAAVLSDALDLEVMNAAMTGAGSAVTEGWIDELDNLGAGSAGVVWALSSHELFVCDSPGRIEGPRDLRRAAFGPLTDSGELERLDWVLGPPGTPVSRASPIGDHWLRIHDGVDPSFTETDPQRVAIQRSRLDNYDDPEVCDVNAEAIVRATDAVVDRGGRITVVAMPVSAEVIDAHPDGASGHAAALDELFSRLGDDVAVVDLSASPPADHFVDLVHLHQRGRARFSADLAAALADVS